jgi:hypothetical protein
MNTVKLVPVSEWVYDLYRVEYWTENAADGGRKIKTIHIAASSENHAWSDANEYVPHGCNCISIEVVKEDVGHPRAIGVMHNGTKVYESGLSHAIRLIGF